jgi:hypothetical protein
MSSTPRPTLTAVIALVLTTSAVSASAAPPPVVPWLNQRPAKASPSPPLASPCEARELHAQLFLQGATGSLVGGVNLLNVGTTSCSLVGRPKISFSGAAAAATQWQVKELAASPAPPDVLADPTGSLRALRPGKSAKVSLFWSNWCGPGADPTGGHAA